MPLPQCVRLCICNIAFTPRYWWRNVVHRRHINQCRPTSNAIPTHLTTRNQITCGQWSQMLVECLQHVHMFASHLSCMCIFCFKHIYSASIYTVRTYFVANVWKKLLSCFPYVLQTFKYRNVACPLYVWQWFLSIPSQTVYVNIVY